MLRKNKLPSEWSEKYDEKNNKYVKYRIRRVSTDGDEFTYCLMEAFIDEDDCDCYRVLFDIPIDFYDTQTNLVEALRKKCVEYNI